MSFPEPESARSDRPARAILSFVIAAVALATFACKREQAASPPPIVQVAEIRGTNVAMTTEFIGQLDSPQNVEVRARVEAFVEKILFTEGQTVQKGDPLFALDARPYQEQLAAARGKLAEAEASLNKAMKDVARLEPLAQKRAIPQQDLDNARAAVEVNRASVLSAKARVEAAELDLSYCDIRAPITGLIGARQVSVGELVGKGQPTLLATISTLDPIWFYCAISEAQYLQAEGRLRASGRNVADLPVTLILADDSIHPEPGRFVFIDRAVDVKTGTLRVRAEFANRNGVLRPGMFGRIRVGIGERTNSIVVPERAVTELQGRHFVWVIDSENKATQRAVKAGDTIGSNVLILEGLSPGERIVVEGAQKLREGIEAQAVTAEQLAQSAGAPAANATPASGSRSARE
jgi:RND family efflux transporter MFP subunit